MSSMASIIWFILLNVYLCSSQNTTTTTATTSTTRAKSNDFYSSSPLEILILVAIIIICPPCIALLCWYQKRKTKKFDKKRTEKTAKIIEQRQLAQQRQFDMHLAHHQGSRGGSMQKQFIQKPAAPFNNTPNTASTDRAASISRPTHRAASMSQPLKTKQNSSNNTIPPPPQQPAPPIPQQPPPNADAEQEQLVPPPPASNSDNKKNGKKQRIKKQKPKQKKSKSSKQQLQYKKVATFEKVKSVSVDDDEIVKVVQESALELPDIAMDVNQSPPKATPIRKSFDAKTGAPLEVVEEKEKEKENKSAKKANLLQIAQEQMGKEPPPSLQTIFGRTVTDVDESSSEEDSLLQRQKDFGSNPDGPDGVKEFVGSPGKLAKPESQFVLTV